MMLSISQSPLPLPDMLQSYDDYKPGMGAEIVEWVKDQTRHRQRQETQITNGSETRLDTSQRNGFSIAVLGVLVAAAIAFWNTYVAIAIVLVSVGGPSAASIVARFIDPRRGDP